MTTARKTVIVCILLGLALAGFGGYEAYSISEKTKAVASWPIVAGYVAESAIMWRTSPSSSDAQPRSTNYDYRLRARTEYLVDGQYYTNATPGVVDIIDRKYFDREPWTNPPTGEIIRLFKEIPQGTLVPVHYNPGNAAESYILNNLSRRMLYGSALFMMLSGAFLALFPFGIALGLRIFRHPSP